MGKSDGFLCCHFTPTSIYDHDVAIWPLLTATPVTSAKLRLQSRAVSLQEDTQGDVSSSGLPASAAITATSWETIQQSTHWKFCSVSPGSLRTLAQRRLYLKSKHLAQLGFMGVGVGWTEGSWHAQRVLCEFHTTLNLSVTSGMTADPRLPPPPLPPGTLVQALCPFPESTSIFPSPCVLVHVLLASFLLVYQKGIIHVLAICFVSTRGLLAALVKAP